MFPGKSLGVYLLLKLVCCAGETTSSLGGGNIPSRHDLDDRLIEEIDLVEIRSLQTKNETSGPACGDECEDEEAAADVATLRTVRLLPFLAILIVLCCCCGGFYYYRKKKAAESA
eukprot:gnl/MRDRNA2_/MRDRNA2_72109_c0_seq1.p1 gnl/MRDRNA2_/MRDRNA2_72109_c0~~gnl/MRDRNA2_/MRDRNA2_72109_c0_seq1.p1  ORF type:complete len:115 (+),score=21.28 gnl/MRDRNA2_/MRDRNA2_72109_c0_seq1:161-505(+)